MALAEHELKASGGKVDSLIKASRDGRVSSRHVLPVPIFTELHLPRDPMVQILHDQIGLAYPVESIGA